MPAPSERIYSVVLPVFYRRNNFKGGQGSMQASFVKDKRNLQMDAVLGDLTIFTDGHIHVLYPG